MVPSEAGSLAEYVTAFCPALDAFTLALPDHELPGTPAGCSFPSHLASSFKKIPRGALLQEKKKKWEPPPPPPRVGRKQRRAAQASSLGSKLPAITPNAKCKLRLLKLERVKDWLLMEQEFVANQERLKPQEERNEEDRSKVRLALFLMQL